MKTEIVDISPDLAREYLKRNTKNVRPLNRGRVQYLADEISQGRWSLTHQGIAFDRDGVLVDGQHRLAAIDRAGVTVKCLVTWGVPDESLSSIDCGTRRNFGIRLGMPARRAAVMGALVRVSMAGKAMAALHPYDISFADAAFGDSYDLGAERVRYWGSGRRGVAKAPQVAAMMVLLKVHADIRDDLAGKFDAFTSGEIGGLPPAVQGYWRQCAGAGSFQRAIDRNAVDFARAWSAFDPEGRRDPGSKNFMVRRDHGAICADVAKQHIAPLISAAKAEGKHLELA